MTAQQPKPPVGPERVTLHICRGCGVWTLTLRKICVWCGCRDAPELVQYTREEA